MDRRERPQQRAAHQRLRCSACLLHADTARGEAAQHQLRRGLCDGAVVLTPLSHRTYLRRALSLPPLGRQQRCRTLHRQDQCQQSLQRPAAHDGDQGSPTAQRPDACTHQPAPVTPLPILRTPVIRVARSAEALPRTVSDRDTRAAHRAADPSRTVQPRTHPLYRCRHHQTGHRKAALLPLRTEPSEGTDEETAGRRVRTARQPLPHPAHALHPALAPTSAPAHSRHVRRDVAPAAPLPGADGVLQRPTLRGFGSRPCPSAGRHKRTPSPASRMATPVAQRDSHHRTERGGQPVEHRRLPLPRHRHTH